MRFIFCICVLVLTMAAAQAEGRKLAFVQWKPHECSGLLMLPEHHYEVSQFGPGQYRIDSSLVSQGHFNCIYIIFQATNTLAPMVVRQASVIAAFSIQNQKFAWRSYQTKVEGRPVIRKEALIPNLLPHKRQGSTSNFIWLRIDADSQKFLDQLTPVAEGILQDAAEPVGIPAVTPPVRLKTNSPAPAVGTHR